MVGDERFEEVWRRFGAPVTRYCACASGSREAGADLAAETFARFLMKGEGVREDKTEAWLFTVARNLCTSHYRSESRGRRLTAELGVAQTANAAEQPGHAAPDPDLVAALAQLDADEQLAVYLRVVEQRPYAQVARAVGKSGGATRMLVMRSLRRLKAALTPTPAGIGEAQGDVQNA